MLPVRQPRRSAGDLDGEVHNRVRPPTSPRSRSMPPKTRNNHHIVRAGTLDGSLMALCGVTYTDFSDPGPPPFFEDRPRSAFEDTASTQRESPGLLRAPRNVVTTLSATGHTPPHAWCHAPIIFLCVVARLNDGQQLRACVRS